MSGLPDHSAAVAGVVVLGAALALAGCVGAGQRGAGDARTDDVIIVCGEPVHTGTRVVLWTEPEGMNAYAPAATDETGQPRETFGVREHPEPGRAAEVRRWGWTRQTLATLVDQVVVHYDACGTSRRCFEVLRRRGLSCHFLIDVDGTIYQTLDVQERAWHATVANNRSVGIEIAHIGAYPPGETGPMEAWYAADGDGVRLVVPGALAEGIRTRGFVGRPARDEAVRGVVNGTSLVQYDFTPEQYGALGHLLAALHRALPGIRLACPTDARGRVAPAALPEEDLEAFSGVLGHWHVQENKVDPGPAFSWERVLGEAAAVAGGYRSGPD